MIYDLLDSVFGAVFQGSMIAIPRRFLKMFSSLLPVEIELGSMPYSYDNEIIPIQVLFKVELEILKDLVYLAKVKGFRS